MASQVIQSCDVASKGQRFANYILDILFINILAFLVSLGVGMVAGVFAVMLGKADVLRAVLQDTVLSPGGSFLISCFNVFCYFFVCEALWGRTLAKLITGTRVVSMRGTKPTFDAIGIRTLLRFVPFEPLSFLGKGPGGWHDTWSGTVVVRVQTAQARMVQPVSAPMLRPLSAPRGQSLNAPMAQPLSDPAVLPLTAPMAKSLNAPAVEPRSDPAVQPLSAPMALTGLEVLNAGAASCVPTGQTACAIEPAPVAAMPRARETRSGSKAKWIALAVVIAIFAGLIAVKFCWPVRTAVGFSQYDETDTYDDRDVDYSPKPAPVAPVASPAISDPFASPARPADVASPAPMPAQPASPLPGTIEVEAVVVVDGKIVVYSDLGELTQGRTVHGWKVERITNRDITLRSGSEVRKYPLSQPIMQ